MVGHQNIILSALTCDLSLSHSLIFHLYLCNIVLGSHLIQSAPSSDGESRYFRLQPIDECARLVDDGEVENDRRFTLLQMRQQGVSVSVCVGKEFGGALQICTHVYGIAGLYGSCTFNRLQCLKNVQSIYSF